MPLSVTDSAGWSSWTLAWLGALLCLMAVLPTAGTLAAEPVVKGELARYAEQFHEIDQQLSRDRQNEDQLADWLEQLEAGRALAAGCVATGEKNLERLKEDSQSLGEAAKGEPAELVRKRRELNAAVAEQERQVAECRLLTLSSDELRERVRELLKAAQAERLFARGPSMLVLLLDNWHNASTFLAATRFFIEEHAGLDNLSSGEWLGFGLLIAVAAVFGRILKARRRARVAPPATAPAAAQGVGVSLLAAALHYAPRLFAAVAAAGYIYLITPPLRPVPFINVVLYGLPVYLLCLLAIHMVLAPKAPVRRLVQVDEVHAHSMARRLRILVLLGYIGYLLFSTLFAQHLPEEAYLVTRGIYAALLFMNLIWALWLFARIRRQDELRWIGLLTAMVLVVSLGAEWLGYRNLAQAIVLVIAGSLFAFGILLLLTRLFHEFYDALEQGTSPWPSRLRKRLGVAPGNPLPGLLWFRLTTDLLLWTLFAYTLLHIWQVSSLFMQRLEDWMLAGFSIGEFQLVPARILLAIGAFAALVMLTRWLQTRLERRWFRYARLDHGAREAVVAISGYVMLTVAALIALGIVGFNFGNIALVAGALSVGIGFGLQNIVSNFVSGLILLFERPVKTGDWIIVGSTEGYVKRISIRSTQIQTFDRADVIVPNSELISQQVTNWMLHDTQGRARVPIGVAYGSDTQKVKQVLERIAGEHPSVITDGSYPEPKVLFLGFGDSALNFEVRCFIRNIDNRLQVVSDLNFAIDAAFRAEGIEIPFPQRDLHLRSWPTGPLPDQGDAIK